MASLAAEHGLQAFGLHGLQSLGQQLWRTGLAAPQHVGSSRIRDQTHVPCTGWWILSHQTTREVPGLGLKDRISIVGDNGVGISDEGGESEQLLLDLYSSKGLKISEAFLNVKFTQILPVVFKRAFSIFRRADEPVVFAM